MVRTGQDTLQTRKTLDVEGKSYDYFSLKALAAEMGDISKLPFTLKVLLENLLRKLMFTLPSEENVSRCVVTAEVVNGEADIALEYRVEEPIGQPVTTALTSSP